MTSPQRETYQLAESSGVPRIGIRIFRPQCTERIWTNRDHQSESDESWPQGNRVPLYFVEFPLYDASVKQSGTMIMVCGLPGSGKTTFARQLESNRNAIRMCPDEWIEAVLADPDDADEKDRLRDAIENLQWELAKNYLLKGLTVILENGFWAEEERTQYAMEAIALGARIELYAMDSSDLDELWRRIELRNQTLRTKTWMMIRHEHEPKWIGFEQPTLEEIAFYDDGAIVRAP